MGINVQICNYVPIEKAKELEKSVNFLSALKTGQKTGSSMPKENSFAIFSEPGMWILFS